MIGGDIIKKSVIFLLVSLIFISNFAISASAGDRGLNFYCAHRRDHLQPSIDKCISFIENYNGYYIDKYHGDTNSDKVIYLTFDAGYENGNISRILDSLKEEKVCGAFFVLGHLIDKNTDLILRMFDEGHLVCNHTFSHKSMVGKTKEELRSELEKLEKLCEEKTGKKMSSYYRPPEGRFDEASLKYADELGYKTVFWSFAYADWDNNKQMSLECAKNKILENIHNGEIMLLHPTSATNAQILKEIIIELKRQGYRFGSLDELC